MRSIFESSVVSIPPDFIFSIINVVALCALVLAIFGFATAIKSAYFHPLSKYPGPRLAGASFLPFWYYRSIGDHNPWFTSLHARYGSVVRFSPDGLSFDSASAWKDIYAQKPTGKASNSIDPRIYRAYDNGEDDITTIQDDAKHGSVRRIFAHAFSTKALKLQEPLLWEHAKKLIARLHKTAGSNQTHEIDLNEIYTRTTFDIMGELAFGESLGLLESDKNMDKVSAMMEATKAEIILDTVAVYPKLRSVLALFTPKRLEEKSEEVYAFSRDLIEKRLQKGRDLPDIWNFVLNRGHHLTLNEMHNNASAFMLAGTDTTATFLGGMTFLLLSHREKLAKLVAEIRKLDGDGVGDGAGGLDSTTLAGLPYLNACFEEALRIYPPASEGFARVIPEGGGSVAGNYLPAGTRVTIPQCAINSSPRNFENPHAFIPERWLPGTGFDKDIKEAMQAFGVGPRNCLGRNLAYMEIRMLIANMLWNFDMELSDKSKNWMKQKTWMMWERGPMFVHVTLRKR